MYDEWSKKNDSSAVVRLRRSLRIPAKYALPFVAENFGIAIALRTRNDRNHDQQFN